MSGASFLAPYDGPWTSVEARHLLRRAAFGIPIGRVEELTSLGRGKAVDAFLEPALREAPPEDPDWLPAMRDQREMREMGQGMSEEEREKARREFQRENREAITKLVLWWMKRMHDSPGALREKMTLFWHGHFAVSAEKVRQAAVNFDLNKRLRAHALGRFEALTLQVAQSPAMLRYLDNDRNVKGKPNENFARELMELFTLGIGNYAEEDVKEAARAFAGWSSDGARFVVRERQRDTGYKRFLGERGAFDGGDIVSILMKREEVAPFIGRKIWEFLAYENPEPELLEEIATRFRSTNYDVADLVSAILNSRAFYSKKSVWTQIKGPVYFLVELHGLLESNTPRAQLVPQMLRLLGQVPFYPPNVKGWEQGRAWINSNTLLLRANIANFLVNGVLPELRDRPRPAPAERRRAREEAKMDDDAAMMQEGHLMDDDREPSMEPGMEDEAPVDIPATKIKPPVDIVATLERLGADSPEDLVDRAVERFIGHPVGAEQRTLLVDSVRGSKNLGNPGRMTEADKDKARGMLHLLLSAVEFQLC